MRLGRRRNGAGHTLIELLVTLVIAGVVASWAVPAFEGWWLGLRVRQAGHHFQGLLEVMRYRSLVTRVPVTICGSRDGIACDRDRGVRIVMFEDRNGNGVVEAGDRVLHHDPFAGSADIWLAWRAFRGTTYLRWAAGRTDSMNGTFTICNRQRRDAWLRQLVVNRTGRARVVLPQRAGAAELRSARRACGWGG